MPMIRNFNEFCTELLKVGFSGAIGGKDDGVFGLFRYGWGAQDESSLFWHTGDPETDPWEWRIRVLDERDDIAYGKVFFRKAGYITKEWYPYFLAARRERQTFNDTYADGLYSQYAKRVFETLSHHGAMPVHILKTLAGFGREDKSRFEKALTDLQMGLFITMCGQAQKQSKTGEEYGWASMMYCVTDEFWRRDVFEKAALIGADEAMETIANRIYGLNPIADKKKVSKFILGRNG